MTTSYNRRDFNAIRDYEFNRQLAHADPDNISDANNGISNADEVAGASAVVNSLQARYDAAKRVLPKSVADEAVLYGKREFEQAYNAPAQDIDALIAARQSPYRPTAVPDDARMGYIWEDVNGGGKEGGFKDAFQEERTLAQIMPAFERTVLAAPYIGNTLPRKYMCIWRTPEGVLVSGSLQDFCDAKDEAKKLASGDPMSPPVEADKMVQGMTWAKFIKD